MDPNKFPVQTYMHAPAQAVAKLVDETKDSRRLVAGLDGWEAPLLDMLVAAENLEGTTSAAALAQELQAAAGDEGPSLDRPSPAQRESGGDLRHGHVACSKALLMPTTVASC